MNLKLIFSLFKFLKQKLGQFWDILPSEGMLRVIPEDFESFYRLVTEISSMFKKY